MGPSLTMSPWARSSQLRLRRRLRLSTCAGIGRILPRLAAIGISANSSSVHDLPRFSRCTVQNTSSIFQGRFKQFPDYGEAQRAFVYQRLERMDRELNGHQLVAGDRFTIADITALVAIDIGGRLADIKIAPKLAYLTRWHELVSSRPSAKA